jgi:MFS family permease
VRVADSDHVSRGRQLILAVFWFGISFVWGALLAVTLPFLLVPAHPGPGNPTLVSPDTKNTALSLLETGGLLIAILVQPAAGALSDRLRTRWGRRRPMIAVGALGAIASLLLISVSTSFLFLVVVYCALQLFMNVGQGAYQGLLPDTVPVAQRGRASGWLGVATLSGQVAGVVTAGPLPPRTACVVIAAVVLVTAGITLIGVAEHPAHPAARVALPRVPRNPLVALHGYLAEFGQYRDFCWVVFSRFLIFTSLAAIQRFAAYYISDTFRGNYRLFGFDLGSAQTATSAMLGIVILFGIFTAYPAVRLSDRVGRRAVIVAAALLGACASVLFFFADSITEVVVFAIPVALTFGMVVSVDWAFMADLAPRRRAGKFLGFSNLATAGAQAAAPAVLGPVIDTVNRGTSPGGGVPGSGGYRVLFIVGAVFFVLGAVVLRRVRTTRLNDDDEVAVTTGSPRHEPEATVS